jgi:UDP:flavonoid glycosyltransferase YjiC (YdhE family)
LKVGSGRRFSATTKKSLVSDLQAVLDPQCLVRARALGARMTPSAESVAATADLVESFARMRRVG